MISVLVYFLHFSGVLVSVRSYASVNVTNNQPITQFPLKVQTSKTFDFSRYFERTYFEPLIPKDATLSRTNKCFDIRNDRSTF